MSHTSLVQLVAILFDRLSKEKQDEIIRLLQEGVE